METACKEDDSRLVELCISRDPAAWDMLVRKYTGLVYAAISNRVRKYGLSLLRHDIEDITQDIFASVWGGNKLASIKNRKDISCWLAVISGNTAVQHLRKRSTKEILCEECPPPPVLPVDKEPLPGIDIMLEGVPPKESLAIQLSILYDKKYREIADLLDIPVNTVSSYVKRAKARLKKKLKYLSRH